MFDSILLLFSVTLLHFTSHCSHIAGSIWDHEYNTLTSAEEVKSGDLWEMEVDLRSREEEERTLHWFVNGKQQKGFIYGVPERVEFGV